MPKYLNLIVIILVEKKTQTETIQKMMFPIVCVIAVLFASFSEANLNANLWQAHNSESLSGADFPESGLLASKPNTAIGFTGQLLTKLDILVSPVMF